MKRIPKKRVIDGVLYEAVCRIDETYGQKVTRQAAREYELDDLDDLPDGSPALYWVDPEYEEEDRLVIVTIYGNGEDYIEISVWDNDEDEFIRDYDADDKRKALKDFESICSLIDSKDSSIKSVARRYGLESAV